VSKRGKDKRPLLTSTSFLLLLMIVGTGFFWFFGREPGVRNLPYGELMQILQANDPALTLEKAKAARSEIRGEIVPAIRFPMARPRQSGWSKSRLFARGGRSRRTRNC